MLLTKSRIRQYFAALACNLSVMASGTCFAWLEPLTLKLSTEGNELYIGSEGVSWLVSVIEIGCVIAPIPTGLLADRFGRKKVLLSTCPMFVLSWLLVLYSWSWEFLTVVRLLQGIAIGIVFTVAPMYIAEISEPQIRGQLSGHFQTTWYLGILYVYIAGKHLALDEYVGLCLAIAIIFAVTFLSVPESPYYLLMKGKEKEACNSLQWCRHNENIKEEFDELKKSVNDDMSMKKGGWTELFATKKDRKAFFLVQVVCITRFMTGMPSIVNYATATFAENSGGLFTQDELTIALGTLLTLIAVLSAFLSDYFGRRTLLLWSSFGCAVSHFVLGLYYYLYSVIHVDVNPYSWALYSGLIGFCFFSDIGLGPLMQTLQAELFPSNTRAIGGGISEVTAGLSSFINLKMYQPITDNIGVYLNFWIYSIISLIGGVLIWIYASETAGKSLAQIQVDLTKKENQESESSIE